MKTEILSLLRERGDYVSGQELCQRFGVSRTAVWKAVGQLKKEGYSIEAVKNRGYRLQSAEDVYSQEELTERMRTNWAGRPVHFFESLGSTNIQAKIEAENGASHGTLVVADMQTAGRGRRGRCWSSPSGANIYFTLILKPDFAPDKASMLTLIMAYAVARGMEKTLRETVPILPPGKENGGGKAGETKQKSISGIKWPNDLVINGKKVCGILTEMSAERDYIQYVVIGCGINVKEQGFPPEVAQKATYMEAECGWTISRTRLLADIMEAFEEEYTDFLAMESLEGLKEKYNAMLVNCGRQVCVLDPAGEYCGIAKGINASGELLVELPDKTVREVYAGEVSVRGVYGYV